MNDNEQNNLTAPVVGAVNSVRVLPPFPNSPVVFVVTHRMNRSHFKRFSNIYMSEDSARLETEWLRKYNPKLETGIEVWTLVTEEDASTHWERATQHKESERG